MIFLWCLIVICVIVVCVCGGMCVFVCILSEECLKFSLWLCLYVFVCDSVYSIMFYFVCVCLCVWFCESGETERTRAVWPSRVITIRWDQTVSNVCFSGSRSGLKSPAEARGLPYPGQLWAANHASDRGTWWAEPAVQQDDGLQYADGATVGPPAPVLVYCTPHASLWQVRHNFTQRDTHLHNSDLCVFEVEEVSLLNETIR